MEKLFIIIGLTGIMYLFSKKIKIGNPFYFTIVMGVMFIMASWVMD